MHPIYAIFAVEAHLTRRMKDTLEKRNVAGLLLQLLITAVVCNVLGSGLMLLLFWLQDPSTFAIDQLTTYLGSTAGVGKAGLGVVHFCTFTLASIVYYWLVLSEGKPLLRFFDLDAIPHPILITGFVAMMLLLYPTMALLVRISGLVPLPDYLSSIDDDQMQLMSGILQMDNVWQYLGTLAVVAVLPAIGEELLFRGLLQRILVAKFTQPHVAIFCTSLIFAGVHMQVEGLLPKLILGLAMGYAYYWTGHLLYSMIMHGINNGVAVTALYLSGVDLTSTEVADQTVPWMPMLVTVGISLTLLYYLLMYLRGKITEYGREA